METYNSIELTKQLVKDGKISQEIAETIFPELKESKDERIIGRIKMAIESYWSDEPLDEILAWLEKQGQHKPVISDEAIREGVAHFGITQYQISNWLKKYIDIEKQGSQNLANSAKTCKVEQKPTLPGFEQQEGVAGRDYIPVEWVEAIENYGKWKIVRVNEQNPAWSEDDEKMVEDLVEAIDTRYAVTDYNEMVAWLKSLKERYTWKPTMQQLTILSKAIELRFLHESDGTILMTLYHELKKLTE